MSYQEGEGRRRKQSTFFQHVSVGDDRGKQVPRKEGDSTCISGAPELCKTLSGRKEFTVVPFFFPIEFKFTNCELAKSHVNSRLEMLRRRPSPFRSPCLQPRLLLPPLPDAVPGDHSGRGPP